MTRRLKTTILFLLVIWCFLILNAESITQNANAEVEQFVYNWSYPHYQDNKLVWEAQGKTAVMRENEMIITIFELTYYFNPAEIGSAEGKNSSGAKLVIKADMASFDKQRQKVSLYERINVKKASDPPGENDETLQTKTLQVNMADKTFFTDETVTITKTDMTITGKGCNGTLDFGTFSFLGNVEASMQNCNCSALSLNTLFTPRNNDLDSEDLNKMMSSITFTCRGPLALEKIDPKDIPLPASAKPNGSERLAQRITLSDAVRINSTDVTNPISPTGQISLEAGKLVLMLDKRENPTTKRNSTYVANISASQNVKVYDKLNHCESDMLECDEITGNIALKGNADSLAIITRPLSTTQTTTESFVTIAAQIIAIQSANENMILAGRKKIVFSDGSIYKAEDTAGKNTGTVNQVEITAENDAVISFAENQIVMEKNVRLSQKSRESNSSKTSALKAQILCGHLLIRWDQNRNQLDKLRAENDVAIMSEGNGKAFCDILEWTPSKSTINLKSATAVKIWHQNNLMEAEEIVITTETGDILDKWSKIETKNTSGGRIIINPPGKQNE